MSEPVVIRAFRILEELALEPVLSLKELTERTGIPKPTVYRLLQTLREIGYVAEHGPRGSYSIGNRVVQVFRRDPGLELKRLAHPLLVSLYDKFNETVNLAVADRTQINYLVVMETTRPLRWVVEPGSSDPMHTTALGRAILAFLDRESREALLRELAKEHGVRRAGDFVARQTAILETVRRRGWARDDKETNPEVVCIAIPLLDNEGTPLGSISLSVPNARASEEYQEQIISALMDCSRRFTAQFAQPKTFSQQKS